MEGHRAVVLALLACAACAVTASFAQQAQPAQAKRPESSTNRPPPAARALAANPLSSEDQQRISELVRTVLTNAPSPVSVTIAPGPLPNTAIVQRSARRDGHEVTVEAITLRKSGNDWKIESVAR